MITCDRCGAHNARKSVRVRLIFEEMSGDDWYTLPEKESGIVNTTIDLCDGCLYSIPEKVNEILKPLPRIGASK